MFYFSVFLRRLNTVSAAPDTIAANTASTSIMPLSPVCGTSVFVLVLVLVLLSVGVLSVPPLVRLSVGFTGLLLDMVSEFSTVLSGSLDSSDSLTAHLLPQKVYHIYLHILPQKTPPHRILSSFHNHLILSVLNNFGGYTLTNPPFRSCTEWRVYIQLFYCNFASCFLAV